MDGQQQALAVRASIDVTISIAIGNEWNNKARSVSRVLQHAYL
jgi:hypothetical protein